MRKSTLAVMFLAFLSSAGGTVAPDANANAHFTLRFNSRGLTSLKRTKDAFDTDYLARGATLGDVFLRYKMDRGRWQDTSASRAADRRAPAGSPAEPSRDFVFVDRYYLYHGDFNDHYGDLELTSGFRLEGQALVWTIRLKNQADRPIEVGDLGVRLPFNTEGRWDWEETTTRRVLRHSFVGGNNSFIFWTRPNSVGPFLVMTPLSESPSRRTRKSFRATKLEFTDETGVYIHSKAAGEDVKKLGGNWRQPHTGTTLGAAGSPEAEAVYGFKFRWADGYEGVRDVLYDEGLIDVNVVPGMTIPVDLEAMFALRTKEKIDRIEPEFPAATHLEDLGTKARNTRVYRVRFDKLGENMLTVRYAGGRTTRLEFFVTEPLETLIKKRAAFIVSHQQHRDPAKWYNGLFSDWDMKNKVLRSPEDIDNIKDYWFASDDPGLCKAPYVAEKNVHFPDPKEIEAVEYHIKNFVWGKLQRTDKETWAYGIYGIPNWKVNRDSGPKDRDGWVGHLWRLYDYPHVIMLYLDMYRIAKAYPGLTRYLDAAGYLRRAYGTAHALFTVPLETGNWEGKQIGLFNELVIADVIEALEAEGMKAEASVVRADWEDKVAHFINDRPDFFWAEYPFGPCAFESTAAFAKYAMAETAKPNRSLKVTPADAARFLEDQLKANIVMRGWLEPAYYLLGNSRPGSMFYMSQMGGWGVVDYALHFAKNPAPYLRLGYASFLSAWGLMNTGTPESNFGFWYPGKENDGGAGTRFIADAFGEELGTAVPRGVWYYGGECDLGFGGAVRTAATIVTDDPLFGLFAYGGKAEKKDGAVEVVPRDGLRQRLHVVRGGQSLHLVLDRDGFVAGRAIRIGDDLGTIAFSLENRSGDLHDSRMKISGLPAGRYDIILGEKVQAPITAVAGQESTATLSVPEKGDVRVQIRKAGP